MRLAACTALSALLSVPVLAQAPPSVGEILKKVANTYTSLTEWDFEATITSTVERGGRITHPLRTAGKGPSKRRMEVGDEESGRFLIVADGQNIWFYRPQGNQYTRKTQTAEPAETMLYYKAPILAYQMGPTSEGDARLLREESIQIANTKADCYVIQFQSARIPRPVTTWWVDKRRFLVLRDDQAGGPEPLAGSSTTFTRTQVNGVADDLFVFTPPPGAKEQPAH